MRSNYKLSLSSRASVRSLIVACLPGAGLAFVAGSPALGAAYISCGSDGLSIDGNSVGTHGVGANVPSTNNSGIGTNADRPPVCGQGVRG